MIVFAFLMKLGVLTVGSYLLVVILYAEIIRRCHRGCCQRDPWGAETWGWPVVVVRTVSALCGGFRDR